MRQKIGPKLVQLYRCATGLDVIAGLVRGDTGHRVDLCLRDGSIVHYWPSTGETTVSDTRHDYTEEAT